MRSGFLALCFSVIGLSLLQSSIAERKRCLHATDVVKTIGFAAANGSSEAAEALPFKRGASCTFNKVSAMKVFGESRTRGSWTCRLMIKNASPHVAGVFSKDDIQVTEHFSLDEDHALAIVEPKQSDANGERHRYSIATEVTISESCRISRLRVIIWDSVVAPHPRTVESLVTLRTRREAELAGLIKAQYENIWKNVREAARQPKRTSRAPTGIERESLGS